MHRALLALFPVLLAASCVGTTGGQIVDFPAAAAGPADASGGQLEFTTDSGWHVILTQATLHVGAIYLDQAVPVSGSQGTNCILPGLYVAEVTSGRDVDLLSPEPQPFPVLGHGTTLPALAGQVWLTGGDVNQVEDSTPILQIAGTADEAGQVVSFMGTVTIG